MPIEFPTDIQFLEARIARLERSQKYRQTFAERMARTGNQDFLKRYEIEDEELAVARLLLGLVKVVV